MLDRDILQTIAMYADTGDTSEHWEHRAGIAALKPGRVDRKH